MTDDWLLYCASLLLLQAGTEDIKKVLHQLSKLRYELETDKAMVPIAVGPDVEEWKATFDAYSKCQGREEPKWYEVSWLFAECFMYRKTAEILNSRYVFGLKNTITVDKSPLALI